MAKVQNENRRLFLLAYFGDELLVETFKKISDLDEKEIAISIKHLEKSGYKVTKK